MKELIRYVLILFGICTALVIVISALSMAGPTIAGSDAPTGTGLAAWTIQSEITDEQVDRTVKLAGADVALRDSESRRIVAIGEATQASSTGIGNIIISIGMALACCGLVIFAFDTVGRFRPR